MRCKRVDGRHHAHGIGEIIKSDPPQNYAHTSRRSRGCSRSRVRIHQHSEPTPLDYTIVNLDCHIGKTYSGRSERETVGGYGEIHRRVGCAHTVAGVSEGCR